MFLNPPPGKGDSHIYRATGRPWLGSAFDDDARIPESGVKDTGTAPISGWPSAPPHRAAAWDGAEYMIHSGDTISGLAARYLGDPARWREIWSMQTGYGSRADGSRRYVDRNYHKIDPSSSNPGPLPSPGMYLVMPREAQLRAEAFTEAGQSAPAAPSAPGNLPGGSGGALPAPVKAAAKTGTTIALGAAALGALYLATR